MQWRFLFEGYNQLYTFPLILAGLFLFLQFLGFGLSNVDLGFDADVDADLDVDADVDLDIDADADAELDVDAADIGLFMGALTWFHVGKVPFAFLLLLFVFAYGFVGLFVTTYLTDRAGVAGFWELVAWSLPASFLGGMVVTRLLGGVVGRLLAPSKISKRMNAAMLVGRTAKVVSLKVDAESGRGLVKDDEGDLHTVFLRTAGDGAAEKGALVRLTRYVAKDNIYICRERREDDPPATGGDF